MRDKPSLPSLSLNTFVLFLLPTIFPLSPTYLLRITLVTITHKTSTDRTILRSLSIRGLNLLTTNLNQLDQLELVIPLLSNGRNLFPVLPLPDLNLHLKLEVNLIPSLQSTTLLDQCNEPFRIKPLRLVLLSNPPSLIGMMDVAMRKDTLVEKVEMLE